MKLAIGNDHAGPDHKKAIEKFLIDNNHEVINFGTNNCDSVDYPDFGHQVATAVKKNEVELGILICGSGNGIAMTANKHENVRCALCWTSEIADLAKQHNNANVISIPARYTTSEEAVDIVKTFLSSSFEGGRHQKRVDKINL